MNMRASTLRVSLAALALALVGHACSAPVASDRVVAHPPGSAPFKSVGVMLDRRCGTLDCHGSTQRNLRLFGQSGLRLQKGDVPGVTRTTELELEEDYRSVVGLEPEMMTTVLREGGAKPERLRIVRKARGTEGHLGGKLFTVGDDQDVCLTSWLTGTVDEAACGRAIATTDPLLDPTVE